MKGLTKQQKKVLTFVKTYIRKHGIPPTRQDITDHFGWVSTHSAQCHLVALQKKKVIEITDGKARAIKVLL